MRNQQYRTCIHMSAEEYAMLKRKSQKANLSANAWLMHQMKSNPPILQREQELRKMIAFMNTAGREINVVARAFNSGCGTATQLRFAVQRLGEVVQRMIELRKKGYLHAD